MAVQWLRLCLPVYRLRVQFLFGKLIFHMLCGHKMKEKKNNRDTIVTNSIKTLKMAHMKKIL